MEKETEIYKKITKSSLKVVENLHPPQLWKTKPQRERFLRPVSDSNLGRPAHQGPDLDRPDFTGIT